MAPRPLPLDPIAEARRHWIERWSAGEHMAAATSIIRVYQLVMRTVEDVLKPYDLSFASFEALRLLSFSRRGMLPLGKMSERLMVHPASITNTIDRLQARGLVRRRADPKDRRRVLAEITPAGSRLVEEATIPLNASAYGLGALDEAQAAAVSRLLREVRVGAGDIDPATPNPWSGAELVES